MIPVVSCAAMNSTNRTQDDHVCNCPEGSPFNWRTYKQTIQWRTQHDGASERATKAKDRLEEAKKSSNNS